MRTALAIVAVIAPVAVVAQVAPAPVPAPAPAAAPEQADEEEASGPDVVVTGSRTPPGSVVGDIPPEITLSPADVRSYGVSSVAELLTELTPQTTSGRGQGGAPVVLLNGRRTSGFQEIRNLPTEAIARVDILPEEVALKYGYRADQRVVNFVLRRRFRAATVEVQDRVATQGGRNAPSTELDLVQIARDTRASLHLEYDAASALTEAERDITATGTAAAVGQGGVAIDQTRFRTLLPSTRAFNANGVYARPLGAAQASLNGSIATSDSTGTFGLPTVSLTTPTGTILRAIDAGEPLRQRSQSLTAHLGSTVNGSLGGAGSAWRWTVTGVYDRVESRTFTDTGVDASAFQARLAAGDPGANPLGLLGPADIGQGAANRGFSTSSSAGVDGLLNGTVVALPAGNVSTALRLGVDTLDFDSRSFRAGLDTRGQVSRDTANGQLNVDVPLTSRARGVLGAIGTLSLNGNVGVDRLSDFGTLTTIGYGANWSPIDAVRVIASHTTQEDAPSAQQLGNPQVTTPNVRVFDYVRGTTATVTTLSGGNPGLFSDNRRTTKLGLTIKPRSRLDLTLVANYVSASTDDPIASFPAATAAIEAAFPDRFTRDGAGNLLRLDSRPINFARSERSEMRWGFNLSLPLKSKIQREIEAFRAGTGPNPFVGLTPPGGRRGGGESGRPSGEGRPGGGRGGFGGGGGRFGGGGGGGGQGGGRLQFAAYHTWHFTDRVTVADGGPVLDLLNGDAIGGSGGQSRHEVEVQAGYSNNGIGVRLSGNYRSATQVQGGSSAASSVGTLNFGSLATANLRVFADLGQRLDLIKAHPWPRGVRVVLGVDNVANTRQRVTDATGTVPVNFQPGYVDALGRTVRLSVRKLFF
ncbi:TonB-dependent receptor [Sphingomonas sp.]|uniref:TonB-dependent receptor n=1 Tax=Sphingomonas sp. TaxID=28214 RepID=UPI0035BBEF23